MLLNSHKSFYENTSLKPSLRKQNYESIIKVAVSRVVNSHILKYVLMT